MNSVAKPTEQPISAETMELVLGAGDLSRLTPVQRVEYMVRTCQTIGLNPLTRPFRFMTFQGQTSMYATRDCTDQLRSIRTIDIKIAEKRMEDDLFIVTVTATAPDGRHDEDIGAVALGSLKGEARANATMKAITKAKRRVTLSICGLGYLDETEVDTLVGARTYDADGSGTRDVAPVQTQTIKTGSGQVITSTEVPPPPVEDVKPRQTWRGLVALLDTALKSCATEADVVAIQNEPEAQKIYLHGSEAVKEELSILVQTAMDRTRDTHDAMPEDV
jgi:hypothetical protein